MKKRKKSKDGAELTNDAVKYGRLVTEELMPCGDDLILITLKGHLIIESMLEMNLTRLLAVECLPKNRGRLSFAQKLELLQTIVIHRPPGPNTDLFCAVGKLNDLRNGIAHSLKDQVQIKKEATDFINTWKSALAENGTKMKLSEATLLPEQLKGCIIGLWGFLFGVRTQLHILSRQSEK